MVKTDLDQHRGPGTPSSVTEDPRVHREMQSQGLTLDYLTQFVLGMTGRRFSASFETEAYSLEDVRPNTGYLAFQRDSGGIVTQLRYGEGPDAPAVVVEVKKSGVPIFGNFSNPDQIRGFALPKDTLLVPFTRPRYA